MDSENVSEKYISKCHEILDGWNIPPDAAGTTSAEQLFNRLTTYAKLRHDDDMV
jgi:hypothetical protein